MKHNKSKISRAATSTANTTNRATTGFAKMTHRLVTGTMGGMKSNLKKRNK